MSKILNNSLKYINGYNLVLNSRQLCDLECIGNGAFNPLTTFLNEKDYNSVVNSNYLANGKLFPIPITLDIDENKLNEIENSKQENICLRDKEFNLLAVMKLSDIWKPNKKKEAEKVFGGDSEHPAISYLYEKTGSYYISGKLNFHQLPVHYDYNDLRHTPTELKKLFPSNKPIVAFQTRNPMHKAHMELVGAATKLVDGVALIHPVVGLTKPGDIDYHTRIKCYKSIIKDNQIKTQSGNIDTILSLLPLAMRMGGPREALLHAIIRQNYGATHFICGRDHAGPGSNSKGKDFYKPYEARDFLLNFQNCLDIKVVPFDMMGYVKETKKYIPIPKIKKNQTALQLSGTEVRKRLKNDEEIPDWFSPPNVVKILKENYPPKDKQGITLFFTGLSGSGKSTIANGLIEKIHEVTSRPIIKLDGDEVRTFLSSELGFSKEHRDLNIKRIGFVSSLLTKSRSVTVCAAIAPYEKTRNQVREMVEETGGKFIEIYVDASLEECKKRDRKGLYDKAEKGLIPEFTGISSPYEEPKNPEIILKTDNSSVNKNVNNILKYLYDNKYLRIL